MKKKEKNNEELSQFLKVHILEIPGMIYLKFEYGALMVEGILSAKSPNFVQAAESYIFVNIVLLLFLSIYSREQ